MNRTHLVGLSFTGFVCAAFYFFTLKMSKRRKYSGPDQYSVSQPPAEGHNTPSGTTGINSNCDDKNKLTHEQANYIISMLRSEGDSGKIKALCTIINMSAFSCNHSILRDCGCLNALVSIIKTQDVLFQFSGIVSSWPVVDNTLMCLSNLTLNEENQKLIQAAVPAVISFLQNPFIGDLTRKNCHGVLLNISLFSPIHPSFVPLLPHLATQIFVLRRENASVNFYRLSALKIFVNLANCDEWAARILDFDVPQVVVQTPVTCALFKQSEVLLRWLTLLSLLADYISKRSTGFLSNATTANKIMTLFKNKNYLDTLKQDLEKCKQQNLEGQSELYCVASSLYDKLRMLEDT